MIVEVRLRSEDTVMIAQSFNFSNFIILLSKLIAREPPLAGTVLVHQVRWGSSGKPLFPTELRAVITCCQLVTCLRALDFACIAIGEAMMYHLQRFDWLDRLCICKLLRIVMVGGKGKIYCWRVSLSLRRATRKLLIWRGFDLQLPPTWSRL